MVTRKKDPTTDKTRSPKYPKPTKQSRRGCTLEVMINGVRVELSPELETALERAYKGLLQSEPTEMTTTQAAEYLDVSRPFVVKLIKQQLLPCRMINKHRRIPTAALRKYKEKMFREAKSAADELAQLSQDLGLYDLEGPAPKAP